MAAHEHLNSQLFPKLYHGSKKTDVDFEPGDLIHPTPQSIEFKPDGSRVPEEELVRTVHASNSSAWASMYGHVYEVEPTDHENTWNIGDSDGPGGGADEYVSTAPWKVVRRVPEEDASPEWYQRIGLYNAEDVARRKAYWDKRRGNA